MRPTLAIHHPDDAGQGSAEALCDAVPAFAIGCGSPDLAHFVFSEAGVGIVSTDMAGAERLVAEYVVPVEGVVASSDYFEVAETIVILDPILMVYDHFNGYGADKGFDDYAMQFLADVFASGVLDDEQSVSVLIPPTTHECPSATYQQAIGVNPVTRATSSILPSGISDFHAGNYTSERR